MCTICKEITKTLILYLSKIVHTKFFNFATPIFTIKTSNFNKEKYKLSIVVAKEALTRLLRLYNTNNLITLTRPGKFRNSKNCNATMIKSFNFTDTIIHIMQM